MVKSVRELLNGSILPLHPDEIVTADGTGDIFDISNLGGDHFAAVIHITSVHGTGVHLSVHLNNYDPVTTLSDSILYFTRATATTAEWINALTSGKKFGNKIKLTWALAGSAVPKVGFIISLHIKPT